MHPGLPPVLPLPHTHNVERGSEFYQIKLRGEKTALCQITCKQLPPPFINVAVEILKEQAGNGFTSQQLRESKAKMLKLYAEADSGASAEDIFASVKAE